MTPEAPAVPPHSGSALLRKDILKGMVRLAVAAVACSMCPWLSWTAPTTSCRDSRLSLKPLLMQGPCFAIRQPGRGLTGP